MELKLRLTRQDLLALAKSQGGWRLSLYLPLNKAGRLGNQASRLLKELRSRSRKAAAEQGLTSDEIGELLEPVNRILEGADFGPIQGDGLVLFCARDSSVAFSLPFVPPALAEIDRQYRLDLLLPLVLEDDRFYLLDLSLNAIRLWEGNRYSLGELGLEGVETSLKEAFHWEDSQFPSLAHSLAPPGGKGGRGISQYYSHGGGDDKDLKRDILSFFRRIDKSLQSRIDPQVPLILAGVEYLLPLFREANTHANLLGEGVTGSPDSFTPKVLHAKAWACLGTSFLGKRNATLARYREGLVSGRTASGISDVLPCAYQGRISHLFLRKGYRPWGAYDAALGKVTLFDSPGPESLDLCNLTCIRTFLTDGQIFLLDAPEMPADGQDIAALCRF